MRRTGLPPKACEQLLDIETDHEHDKDRWYKQQSIEQQIIVGAVIFCEKIVQCLHTVPADERVCQIHSVGVLTALCQKVREWVCVPRMLLFPAQRFHSNFDMDE